MEPPPEQALLMDLEQRVKEALQKHSLEDVLEYLRHELWQIECSSLYATKGGIHGAPDWDQLQTLIRVIKTVIAKLEKGELKPPKQLTQTTFEGVNIEPWKCDLPFKFRLKKLRRKSLNYSSKGDGNLDSFIQTPQH